MAIMDRMGLGAKLGLGFGGLLLVVGAVVALSMVQLGRMHADVTAIVEEDWAKAAAASRITAATRANARRTMELFLTEDDAQRRLIHERIEDNKKIVTEALAVLDGLVRRPDARALLERIKPKRAAYVQSFTAVANMVGSGDLAGAQRLLKAETLPAIDALQADVDALSALQSQVAADSGAAVVKGIDTMRWTLGVAFLAWPVLWVAPIDTVRRLVEYQILQSATPHGPF